MKKLLHYGGNIAEAILAFVLYSVVETLYFMPYQIRRKYKLDLHVQMVIAAAITVLVIWFLFWMYKKQLKEVNFWGFNKEPHWSMNRIWIAFLGFILIIAVQVALYSILGSNSSQPENQKALNAISKQSGDMFQILVVVVGPICEEIIFRGMFFNTFFTKPSRMNKWLGIIVSGFIFAYLHDPRFSKFILIYWGMGCVLGWTYMRSKDLRYSIIVHMLNNFLTVL